MSFKQFFNIVFTFGVHRKYQRTLGDTKDCPGEKIFFLQLFLTKIFDRKIFFDQEKFC